MVPNPELAGLGLVDEPRERAYDDLVRLAARTLGTPVSLMSIVQPERNRQFFAGEVGLSAPWADLRQTPMSHSFCSHVVTRGRSFVVDDANAHPAVRGNPAIADLGLVAYLGAPIRSPGGAIIGALCVIDGVPRRWGSEDVETLERLAACASDAIDLRATRDAAERLRIEQHCLAATFAHELDEPIAAQRALFDTLLQELGASLPPHLRAGLEAGAGAAERTLATVERLRRYARTLERRITSVPVDLDALATAVREGLGADIERSGGALEVGALPAVDGDPEGLGLMLHELVLNALHFARPERPPRVRLYGHRHRHWVELCVADDGIGLAARDLEGSFDEFCRLQAGAPATGAALALTLCRRVAVDHGGTLQLRSRGGTGAIASVRLPASLRRAVGA